MTPYTLTNQEPISVRLYAVDMDVTMPPEPTSDRNPNRSPASHVAELKQVDMELAFGTCTPGRTSRGWVQ